MVMDMVTIQPEQMETNSLTMGHNGKILMAMDTETMQLEIHLTYSLPMEHNGKILMAMDTEIILQETMLMHKTQQWDDSDGDGYGDNQAGNDPDAFHKTQLNGKTDGDSYGDNAAGNNADAYPNDSTQWFDDGDGYGDNISGTNPDYCGHTKWKQRPVDAEFELMMMKTASRITQMLSKPQKVNLLIPLVVQIPKRTVTKMVLQMHMTSVLQRH